MIAEAKILYISNRLNSFRLNKFNYLNQKDLSLGFVQKTEEHLDNF